MNLEVRGDPPSLTVELPEELTITVPESVAEGVSSAVSELASAAASVSERLESSQALRNLPDRITARLQALPRRLRLPIVGRTVDLSALEVMLRSRDREITDLRARADRNLMIGLAVGTVAGAATVIALLPDRRARLAEIRARLGGLDAPAEYVEDARRIAVRARESVERRVRLAREEAQQVRETTERELWTRYQVAKRDGHVPPAS